MCYERTKIKICHKSFLTFLMPSASFLQPSWISTVTFHLRITSRLFPSTHYRPVQDEYHVSWVCMARINCLCVTNTQAGSYYIHYIHDTHAVSDYVLLLYNTNSLCHLDSLFNVSLWRAGGEASKWWIRKVK